MAQSHLLVALVCAVIVACVHVNAQAGNGFDIAVPATTTNLQCMITAGYTSVIVRAWRSSGVFDTNARTTLSNAAAAGMPHIDVYMFPCPTCSATAAQQFNTMIADLAGVKFGIAWLDIEEDTVGQYWSTSTTTNQAWYSALVAACVASGVRCGVYSNINNWSRIFGSTTFQVGGGSSMPLWYAQYDSVKSFSSYSSNHFGGWATPTAPAMKQYASPTGTTCSLGIDQNWFANAAAIWSGSSTTGSTPHVSSTGSSGSLAQCQVGGVAGGCTDTTTCANINGLSTSHLCPGASNIQCCTPVTCSTGSASGTCISTTMCTADHGTSYAGHCAGAANIQCCVQNSCTVSGVAGKCIDTASCSAFGGTSTSGLCAGASNIQCCVEPAADYQSGGSFNTPTGSQYTNSTSGGGQVSAATGAFGGVVAMMAMMVAVVLGVVMLWA